MSETASLESRLDAVERDIAELKHYVLGHEGRCRWYERTVGSMKDYPEFDEVVKLGREARDAESPSE